MLKLEKKTEYNLFEIYGEKLYSKWLKKYPIFENEDVMAWILDKIDQYTNEGKEASKFSITTYLNPINQYCMYYETDNPSLLLGDDIDQRNLKLKTYLKFLLNCKEDEPRLKELGFNKKPNEVSVRNLIQSRIKSFFSARGANISFGMKTRKSGANKNELYLTKSLLKKIQTKLVSFDYKLICKFESQTGLRISDILEELVKKEGNKSKYNIEFHKEDKSDDGHYFIRNFETQKEKVIIPFVFFTTELSEYIQTYTREKDLAQIELSTLFKTRNNKYIYRNDYLARLKGIVASLGIKGNIKTHGLRKYFISQIAKINDLTEAFKKTLTGHMLGFRDDVYDNNIKNINWFYSEWKKIEQLICVDCIIYDKTNKEIIELRKEMANKDQQIDILTKDYAEINNRFDLLMELLDLSEEKKKLLKEKKTK